LRSLICLLCVPGFGKCIAFAIACVHDGVLLVHICIIVFMVCNVLLSIYLI